MSDAELLKKYEEYKSNTDKIKIDSCEKNVNSKEVVITNIDIPFGSLVKFIKMELSMHTCYVYFKFNLLCYFSYIINKIITII